MYLLSVQSWAVLLQMGLVALTVNGMTQSDRLVGFPWMSERQGRLMMMMMLRRQRLVRDPQPTRVPGKEGERGTTVHLALGSVDPAGTAVCAFLRNAIHRQGADYR